MKTNGMDISKKSALQWSCISFLFWWIAKILSLQVYFFVSDSYNINDNILGIIRESIMIIISIFGFYIIVAKFMKIPKCNYKLFLNKIGLGYNKKGFIISLLLLLGIIINIVIFPPEQINYYLWIQGIQPPFIEELIFRGFIIWLLMNCYNEKKAIIMSSILFMLIHLGTFGLIDLIATFVMGLLWGKIRVDANSIYPTIIIHFFLNTLHPPATQISIYSTWIIQIFMQCYVVYLIIHLGRRAWRNIILSNKSNN